MKNKSPFLLLVVVALMAALMYFFRDLLVLFFSQEKMTEVLNNPATAANVYANFVGGVLTVIAGSAAMLIYTFQERRENLTSTLNWMSEMRDKYHKDEEFQLVRLALVENRGNTLGQLLLEFKEDDLLNGEANAVSTRYYPSLIGNSLPGKIDWAFLKRFTDYLYFFEEILSYGELLHAFYGGLFQPYKTKKLAPALVDHFGWFLRSLYHCCNPNPKNDGWENAMFFVHYLAVNRYRRLTQVGLCIMYAGLKPDAEGARKRAEVETFASEMIGILEEQRPLARNERSLEKMGRHWGAIIYAAKRTLH